MLIKTDFNCFHFETLAKQKDLDYYDGSFHAQYGTVLALSAKAKEPSWELEGLEAKNLLKDARLELEIAVQKLEPQATDDASEQSKKPYADQLFYLGLAQEELRTTRQRLFQVNQALR